MRGEEVKRMLEKFPEHMRMDFRAIVTDEILVRLIAKVIVRCDELERPASEALSYIRELLQLADWPTPKTN